MRTKKKDGVHTGLFSRRHGMGHSSKSIQHGALYDYSCATARQDTVDFLLDFSARAKQNISSYWSRMRRYYDGNHSGAKADAIFGEGCELPFETALCTDGYIQVESQIDAKIPDFEFCPRTGDRDDVVNAAKREAITRFVCDIGDLERKNAVNERRLGIMGSAVWKICWDSEVTCYGNDGEVTVVNPAPWEIYPDPTAKSEDDCEYIGYVYRIHKMKARRLFEADAKRLGLDIDELIGKGDSLSGIVEDITHENSEGYDTENDTVRIVEWWYRQPQDGKCSIEMCKGTDGESEKVDFCWKAGDIALSVFIGNTEIRNIPKYWKNTDSTMFPFVIYNRIPHDSEIWGKSELEPIIPVIDAADRELAFAQLNAAFSSNDIIVAEENALSEECNLDNSPGAVWTLRPGMMGKVQRLGNSAYNQSALFANFNLWRDILQNTTGIFDSFNGSEPERVTTATGIALLNERAKSRSVLKKSGRSAGFKRLYSLIDITALEYYDDGRVVAIRGKGNGEPTVFDEKTITYRFGDFAKGDYIPVLDVKIHVGDGLENSRAFTVSAISDLIKTPITRENYSLVMAFVELIGLPMRKEICDSISAMFEQGEKPLAAEVSDDKASGTEAHKKQHTL